MSDESLKAIESDAPLRHPVPGDLGNAGRRLWKAIVIELPEEDAFAFEFDAREIAVLHAACRQADLVAQLETALKKDGVMIAGAKGQSRMNAVVTELRNSRLALARLLGELGLPNEVTLKPETAEARRNARNAHARWGERGQESLNRA